MSDCADKVSQSVRQTVASTDVSYLQYDTIRYCVFNVQSKTDGQPAYSTMRNQTNLNEKELKIKKYVRTLVLYYITQ